MQHSEGPPQSDGPPAKRRRLSTNEETDVTIKTEAPTTSFSSSLPVDQEQGSKEFRSGITEYVHPDTSGFSGVLKQRYTDFIVNEILPNGTVLHLQNLAAPKQKRKQEKTPAEPEPTPEIEKPETPAPQQNGDAVVKGDAEAAKGESADGQESKPVVEEVEISQEHKTALEATFGTETVKSILTLYSTILQHPDRKRKDFKTVTSNKLTDREIRTKAHQIIRQAFNSKLETTTSNDDTIAISASGGTAKPRGSGTGAGPQKFKGKAGWEELGGEYLHFTLYKENKDTMEAVYFLATQLKVGIKNFQFGGTKDRRAVTVQRCSVYRVYAEQMVSVGKRLRGSKIGDYEYRREGLELGDLGGNEFLITLRDCHFPGEEVMNPEQRKDLGNKLVQESLEAFKKGGFINYYGLQRFGSFTTSTDTVGTKLLQGDYKGAIDDILHYSDATLAAAQADPPQPFSAEASRVKGKSEYKPAAPMTNGAPLISSDDRGRALALHKWYTTHDANAALAMLPRKFSAESNIIRHLGQRGRKTHTLDSLNDHQGALQSIPRNLRLMYIHAYQSLVWNTVAGERWKTYGSVVVEGDLVLIGSGGGANGSESGTNGYKETTDEAGDTVIIPTGTTATDPSDDYQRARPLTAAEASSGQYSIFDIVLPLPGYDVVYPPNAIGDIYKSFMGSDRGGGLDPNDMRRNWRELSLSGGYRKVLGKAEGLAAEVKLYRGHEQLVETDLEKLEGGSAAGITSDKAEVGEEKIGVVLKLSLAPSQYATMALRELMKEDGVKAYRPDYGGGR